MLSMIIMFFLLGIFCIAGLIFGIIALIKIWQKITKPHIQAMMKVDQQVLQQPTYYQNYAQGNTSNNNVSQNEMNLINKYRKLSERSKQKLYDYAETLERREKE